MTALSAFRCLPLLFVLAVVACDDGSNSPTSGAQAGAAGNPLTAGQGGGGQGGVTTSGAAGKATNGGEAGQAAGKSGMAGIGGGMGGNGGGAGIAGQGAPAGAAGKGGSAGQGGAGQGGAGQGGAGQGSAGQGGSSSGGGGSAGSGGCGTDRDCSDPSLPACFSGVCKECWPLAPCGPDAKGICGDDGKCQPGCESNEDCAPLGLSYCEKGPSQPGVCRQPCSQNSDCSMPGQTSCAAGYCAICFYDQECQLLDPEYPICEGARCVAPCKTDSECERPGLPACEKQTGHCVPCLEDSHCPDPGLPICDPFFNSNPLFAVYNKCASCNHLTNQGCTDPTQPICDALWGCSQCLSNEDCPATTPACSGGKCIECESSEQCSLDPLRPVCSFNNCRPCYKDSDCKGQDQYCANYEFCDGCYLDGDCKDPARPHCWPNEGVCKPDAPPGLKDCSSDSDCGGSNTPVCGPDSHCRECKSDGDCKNPDKPLCNSVFRCSECGSEQAKCANNPRGSICFYEGCGCGFDSACLDPKFPSCDKLNSICVECTVNTDCHDPSKPLCLLATHTCHPMPD